MPQTRGPHDPSWCDRHPATGSATRAFAGAGPRRRGDPDHRPVQALRRHRRARPAGASPSTPVRSTATWGPTGRARPPRSGCCWDCTARAADGRELFGLDAWSDPVSAHRRVAYVAGEPFLWPAMTGAETLEFLARLHGGTDIAYRDTLVERFQLDTEQEDPGAVEGQPPEGAADRGARHPRRAAAARRADQRPRPADGGRLPRLRQRGQATRPDGVPLLAHPQRGRGAVRPRRHPQRRGGSSTRARSPSCATSRAQTVEVTFAGQAPTLAPLEGVQAQSAGRQRAALRGRRAASAR